MLRGRLARRQLLGEAAPTFFRSGGPDDDLSCEPEGAAVGGAKAELVLSVPDEPPLSSVLFESLDSAPFFFERGVVPPFERGVVPPLLLLLLLLLPPGPLSLWKADEGLPGPLEEPALPVEALLPVPPRGPSAFLLAEDWPLSRLVSPPIRAVGSRPFSALLAGVRSARLMPLPGLPFMAADCCDGSSSSHRRHGKASQGGGLGGFFA